MSNKNTNVYLDAKTSFLEPSIQQYGSHMVMTNVKKNTRQKFINIDTRFVDDYSYNKTFNQRSIYTFTLPEKLQDVKSIIVSSIELPISFYNFSTSLGNNKIKIVDNDNNITSIIIKDGYYTNTCLLQNEINSSILSLSGEGGDKGMFANNIKFNISNKLYSSFYSPTNNKNIPFKLKNSKLGWALGFRNYQYDLSNIPIISESLVNLNTIRYIYLVLDEFTSGFTNSFISPLQNFIMNKKILARITISTNTFPFGTIQTSTLFNGLLTSDTRYYNGPTDIQKISVQLVNEYGEPVNLNGLDFSFLLNISYE